MNLRKQQDDCVLATTEPIVVATMCEHILSKRSSMHAITMQSLLAVGEACCSGWMRLNINQFWMWSQSCVIANPHINWGMSKQVSNSLMFAIGLQSPYRCMWRWFMNRLLPARSQTCIKVFDRQTLLKRLRIVFLSLTDPDGLQDAVMGLGNVLVRCPGLLSTEESGPDNPPLLQSLVVVHWLMEIEIQVGSESHLHPRTDVYATPHKPGCQRSSECIGIDWGNLD